MQRANFQSCTSAPSAVKDCRKCGQSKPLELFPRDRSRRDGRWHTCTSCNGQRCRFLRWAATEHKKQEVAALPSAQPASRWRLDGLKSYRNKSGELFSRLPPRERFIAQQLFNKYVHRHRGPGLSQPKMALLMATAASNARRVGNSFWGRRMRRLKGWRRQRQRDFKQQPQLKENRSRSVERPRAGYSDAVWAQTSRLTRI
jgi:hypothetical protein